MKALTIVLVAAAFLAAGTMAFADTYYTLSNPRIIHVPQPGETARDSHASLSRVAPDEFDDEDVAPPPRARRAQPKAVTHKEPKAVTRQQARAVTPKEPTRRKPFSVSLPEPPPEPEPEPTGPRRALLSAPPPPTSSIHDGPTPLKPTPRFGQPLPEAPAPLTTFTPPPLPAPPAKPVAVAAPAPEPSTAVPVPADDSDDHLPPPGDPKLAPPEPAQ